MVACIDVPEFSSGKKIIQFLHELKNHDEVVLDFSELGFAKPAGMVLLSQIIRAAVEDGKVDDFRGAVPYSYAANVGFLTVAFWTFRSVMLLAEKIISHFVALILTSGDQAQSVLVYRLVH